MASKTAARQVMAAAGVPIVPGVTEPVATLDEARAAAAEIGYPVVVKAAAGGGRQGDQDRRAGPDELDRAFESARREGKAYFADDAVYLERYLDEPRHVEVQVLADLHGNVIHLGERDCSHPAPPPEDHRGDAVARRHARAARAHRRDRRRRRPGGRVHERGHGGGPARRRTAPTTSSR